MVVTSSDILGVWRALSGNEPLPGWRTISLAEVGTCRIEAARRSPGNEEAILLGFPTMKIGVNVDLPKGQGFTVEKTCLESEEDGFFWLAIVRQPAGMLELFAAMAADLMKLLSTSSQMDEKEVYRKLLGRIRSWQEFMRKGREGLSAEAELGLVGELQVMRELLDQGVPLYTTAKAWQGPLDGLHDYCLAAGAIEVKSTIASEGFPIKIASLEQLDDSQSQPLFLTGLRFSVEPSGMTLPQLINNLRAVFESDQAASKMFESSLLSAGYWDMHEESYTRHFLLNEMRIHLVNEEFPRLVPCNVPTAIRHAQYGLELANLSIENKNMSHILSELGVL